MRPNQPSLQSADGRVGIQKAAVLDRLLRLAAWFVHRPVGLLTLGRALGHGFALTAPGVGLPWRGRGATAPTVLVLLLPALQHLATKLG